MRLKTSLCYITTCKGRLHHLQQTLPRVVGQPGVSCVVVDYACPDQTADWVAANFPCVKLVRVTGEAGFSASHARNLGAQASNADWLAFFDADILWSSKLAKRVIPRLQTGHFYRAQPITLQSWGSVICHRQDFEAIGGYDEAMHGWGGEDDDLIERLSMLGRIADSFPASLIDEIPHDDDARVRFHEVKNRALQRRINILYLQIKLDMLRLTGSMPLQIRQELFNRVKRSLLHAAVARKRNASVECNMPAMHFAPPPINGVVEQWRLDRKLTYSIDIAADDAGVERKLSKK